MSKIFVPQIISLLTFSQVTIDNVGDVFLDTVYNSSEFDEENVMFTKTNDANSGQKATKLVFHYV